MQVEVKLTLPVPLETLTDTLKRVADNQDRIEQLQQDNRDLLAGVARSLDEVLSKAAVTVASPPVAQAGE